MDQVYVRLHNYSKMNVSDLTKLCLLPGLEEGDVYGNYTYEEYGSYYDTGNYGENYYGGNYYGEHYRGENYCGENTDNNIPEENVVECGAENLESTEEDGGSNVTFASASAGVEKALQGAIPRPALGLPPPDVPTSKRPPRPARSPFEDVPLEKETKKKMKMKKVWKSSKSKKKEK
jgi:hypothetical protein